jgi:SAM-dependent methyltransferase
MTPYALFTAQSASVIKKSLLDGELCVDLGGRFNCPFGFKSVDRMYANFCADLNGPYPFDDCSVGIVRAFDFLEHVADKMHSLWEIYRILKPGGFLVSMTPSTIGPDGLAGMGSDQDPTHVSYWNRNSFWYVTDPEKMKYIDNTQVRFEPLVVDNCYPSDWHRENRIPYVVALLRKL